MTPVLRYTPGGFAFIRPGDDPGAVVDALLETDYGEEFCLALDFEPRFAADLMAAGFLLMSSRLGVPGPGKEEGMFVLLPKLHLQRSVLFFPELHVKKSIRSRLSRYELQVDAAFDRILDRCVEVHGEDWLTPPLRELLGKVRCLTDAPARPVSFALYREGTLAAGEVGVTAGRVYTSYSGYYDEDNAGTVQLILLARYLAGVGYSFLDLGMPLEYKDSLGARNIGPRRFVELFRAARM
jgi:Leu/Phe-tRNA-protein transferase